MNERAVDVEPRTGSLAALVGGFLFLFLAAPGSAVAQQADVGSGLLPWLGCWSQVADGPEASASMLCIRPAEEGTGVELLSVEDGQVVGSRSLRVDGARHSSARDGCDGWERGEVSAEGGRVYLHSEHTCEGGVRRVAHGLLSMVSPYEWIDVRSVEVGGAPRTWTSRYRLASRAEVEEAGLDELRMDDNMTVETARMSAARAPDVEAVIEASERLPAEAVRAWIAEQGDPLHVDARRLERMADAGVPDEVVDVVVAVSFPDRFAVNREGSVEEQAPAGAARDRYRRPARSRGWYGPRTRIGYHRSLYLYDPFYSPWAYRGFGSSWGYTGWGYGYRPTVVYVTPRADERPSGRIVNGRGYTRGGSGGTARRANEPSSSSGSSPAPSAGRDRSGSSISPSGGYRGGSSASDTGRRAKPRNSDDGDGN